MAKQRPQREQRFERRMSDAEALMWNVEKDPWLNPSGGSLTMLDRPLDFEHFKATIAALVVEVPRLRERVVSGLGRLSPPVWHPDPEFDLDYHVRRVALPVPGTERQLLDFVSELYQDPYDRTRPLWMFHVIEGLEDGRAALLWRIHHAVADGTGAGRLAEFYIQPTRRFGPAPEVDLEGVIEAALEDDERHPGGFVDSVRDTAAHRVRRQLGVTRRMLGEMAMWGADPRRVQDRAEGIVRGVRSLGGQISLPKLPGLSSLPGLSGSSEEAGADSEEAAEAHEPRGGSPLWRRRSRHRQLEILSFPLDEALASAKALGGSLNDWFVTGAVNGSVAYHDERGVELSTLNTSFVISTRNDRAIGGNSFSPTRFTAPAGPMDPLARFKAIQDAMAAKREEAKGGPGLLSGLAGVVNLLPTSVVTSLARAQGASMDFATSNMRGGRTQFYISGAAVAGTYPFGPLAGTAFNLTTMSAAGRLDMGLFVDPVAVEDPENLRDHLDAAYQELIELSRG